MQEEIQTIALDSWSIDYFEDKFAKPDPWKYFTSIYERTKYQRQLDIIKDRNPNPQRILEIGSAEGAQTHLLAEQFPEANITAIEISSNALGRAKDNLSQFEDRIELINADIAEYEPKIEDGCYDICIWSESIYYLGARFPLTATYDLLDRVMDKLKDKGLLVMANTVGLPEGIPEHAVTKRPIMDCYYSLLCSLASPVLKSNYSEDKLGRMYEYQIWAFELKL
jgi:trans-aconitate methyltransferase